MKLEDFDNRIDPGMRGIIIDETLRGTSVVVLSYTKENLPTADGYMVVRYSIKAIVDSLDSEQGIVSGKYHFSFRRTLDTYPCVVDTITYQPSLLIGEDGHEQVDGGTTSLIMSVVFVDDKKRHKVKTIKLSEEVISRFELMEL